MYNSVEMEVLTSNGNVITEYHKKRNIYIEGRKGSEYSIRLTNKTSQKIMCILSVDGLDIVDGKPASHNSRGYILSAHQSTIIDGWRTDLENVRKFFFTREKKSYSKKSGQGTDNLGVIGLVAFQEKPLYGSIYVNYSPPIDYWPKRSSSYDWNTLGSFSYNSGKATYSSTMGGSKGSSGGGGTVRGASGGNSPQASCEDVAMICCDTFETQAAPIGTGMGEKVESVVHTSSFNRQDVPFYTKTVYYKERKELERMGVITYKKKSAVRRPNPFPQQFCKEV